jgi:hypothetical protein
LKTHALTSVGGTGEGGDGYGGEKEEGRKEVNGFIPYLNSLYRYCSVFVCTASKWKLRRKQRVSQSDGQNFLAAFMYQANGRMNWSHIIGSAQ